MVVVLSSEDKAEFVLNDSLLHKQMAVEMYASKIWASTGCDEQRIQSSDMRF